MAKAIAPVAALLLSVAILLVGNGLLGTLLPVRAQVEAFSPIDIGVLGSAYFFGFACGCVFGPRLVERAGHIRAFTAMVSLASALVLAHAMVLDPVPWWVFRAGSGACFAILYMIIESWLNEKATNQTRGVVFSVYFVINLTMITVGQLMLILEPPSSFLLFSAASILVSLAALPVALTRAEAPAPITEVRLNLRRLYRVSPVGAVGCFAVGLASGPFWALAPVFVQSFGGGVSAVAVFMSITVLAGALGQFPLGRISDRIDRRVVIIAASIGAALAGLLLVAAAVAAPGLLLPATFFFGMFAFPLYSLSVAHANDFADNRQFVETAGGLLLIWASGAVIGPFAASLVIRATGPASLFAFTATAHLALGLFTLYRMRRRAPVAEAVKGGFLDAAIAAQTVSNIDARETQGEPPSPDADGSAPDADGPAPAAA